MVQPEKTHTTVENLPVCAVKGLNQKEEYSHNLDAFFFPFSKTGISATFQLAYGNSGMEVLPTV